MPLGSWRASAGPCRYLDVRVSTSSILTALCDAALRTHDSRSSLFASYGKRSPRGHPSCGSPCARGRSTAYGARSPAVCRLDGGRPADLNRPGAP